MSQAVLTVILPYIKIARPDHWVKHIFAIIGTIIAVAMLHVPVSQFWLNFIVGMFSLGFVTSANYVINEWLDARFDRHHPTKQDRICCQEGLVNARGVYLEYALLTAAGLVLGFWVSTSVGVVAALFILQGLLYNVPPFRWKDVAYLDTILESVNNVLRLMMGWLVVTDLYLPPSSLIVAYWAFGGYLMAVKRLAEYRSINDPQRAGRYRRSFKVYTQDSLILFSFFLAIVSAFFLGVFLLKNRIELLLSFPFIAGLYVWYLRLAFRPDSSAERPEKLYKERWFMVYFVGVCILLLLLFMIDIPVMHYFDQQYYPKFS